MLSRPWADLMYRQALAEPRKYGLVTASPTGLGPAYLAVSRDLGLTGLDHDGDDQAFLVLGLIPCQHREKFAAGARVDELPQTRQFGRQADTILGILAMLDHHRRRGLLDQRELARATHRLRFARQSREPVTCQRGVQFPHFVGDTLQA